MLFRLAWRNIWRNRRRTYITAASILFAVLFASFMDALQRGAWDNMINNVVNYYFGYIQIHQKGYWEEQSIDQAFPVADSLALIQEIEKVEAVLPRIESFAMAAAGENTRGVLVVGIEPEVENSMTNLKARVVEGGYLEAQEGGAMIASGLAEKLELRVGDTLVLISQGYHGVNAAGKYPLRGIVEFGSPELNKQMVYLPLPVAQYFYGAGQLVTSLTLKINDPDDISAILTELNERLDTAAYEIMDWQALLPDLVEARDLDRAGNIIVYIILYLIIAFGIFGTILMMSKEREYEFGVLISIGLQRWQLAFSIWIEVILLGLIGAMAGILASMPVVYYFMVYPIRFSGEYAATMEKYGFPPVFPATFEPEIFLMQALYVFIITALIALYPMWKIWKLEPVKAMRA
jgi:ABC-type lipoprotein release transport system permease subunit